MSSWTKQTPTENTTGYVAVTPGEHVVEIVQVDVEHVTSGTYDGAPATVMTVRVVDGPCTGGEIRYVREVAHEARRGWYDRFLDCAGVPDGAPVDPTNVDAMRGVLVGARARVRVAMSEDGKWPRLKSWISPVRPATGRTTPRAQVVPDDEIPF